MSTKLGRIAEVANLEAKQILDRALILMEYDKLAEAETALRQAIEGAKSEEDESTLITAMCCLGDYLFSLGRDQEAADWFKNVLDRKTDDEHLCEEFEMANEFLREMNP